MKESNLKNKIVTVVQQLPVKKKEMLQLSLSFANNNSKANNIPISEQTIISRTSSSNGTNSINYYDPLSGCVTHSLIDDEFVFSASDSIICMYIIDILYVVYVVL